MKAKFAATSRRARVEKFRKENAKPAAPTWVPWDLWLDGVRSSFIKRFMHCRRQCQLEYEECWSNPRPSEYLEFGSCFHYVMQEGYKLKKRPTRKQIEGFVAAYEKANAARVKGWNFERAWEKLLGLCEIVGDHYFKAWTEDFKDQWLATEREFSVPFKYQDGRVTTLNGTIDGVFVRVNGIGKPETMLLDTKTMGEVSENIPDMMPLNFQFNMYITAWMLLTGHFPDGLVQNIVRRPGQTWKQDETLKAFLQRVEEDIIKRPSWYFQRLDYYPSPDERTLWNVRTLVPVMNEIRMWVEGKLSTFINPYSLTIDKAKAPLFAVLTRGDYSGLIQQPFHGSKRHAGH